MAEFNTGLSEKYISKERVKGFILTLREYLANSDTDELMDLINESLDNLIQDIDEEDQPITLQIEAAVAEMLSDECYCESYSEMLDGIDDEDTIEHLVEKGLWPNPKACDMNDFNFKRFMCDLFDTGYHVDGFQIIKSVAVRLDKTWEIM